MRYQIYLNKETTEIIEKVALEEGKKPSTIIKQLLESMLRIAKTTMNATNLELMNYGKGKQEK